MVSETGVVHISNWRLLGCKLEPRLIVKVSVYGVALFPLSVFRAENTSTTSLVHQIFPVLGGLVAAKKFDLLFWSLDSSDRRFHLVPNGVGYFKFAISPTFTGNKKVFLIKMKGERKILAKFL